MGIALVVSVVSLKRQPTLKDLEKAQQQGRAERLLEVGLQLGVLLSGLAIAVFMGWIAKELM
jgi:flagellar biosynthesis protein FlhB